MCKIGFMFTRLMESLAATGRSRGFSQMPACFRQCSIQVALARAELVAV
jgi:hypothetical protein